MPDRKGTQTMIDAAIARHHNKVVAPVLRNIIATQDDIRRRIIGIDGNGTGAQGVIQLLESKVDSVSTDLSEVVGEMRAIKFSVDSLVNTAKEDAIRVGVLDKRNALDDIRHAKKFKLWMKIAIPVGLFLLGMVEKYLGYKLGW